MKSPRYIDARKKLSKRIRDRVYGFDDRTCVYCGAQENLSLDHIVPLSTCSERWWTAVVNHQINLVTACKMCNQSRNVQPPTIMRYGRFFAFPTLFTVYLKRTEVALQSVYDRGLKTQLEQIRKWEKRMNSKAK